MDLSSAHLSWAHLLYEEDSAGVFLLVTLLLGGGAAFLAGRAVAAGWRPVAQALFYGLLIGGAVRFLHFALFDGTLLSLHFYLVDAAVCVGLAALGYRVTRVRRMLGQYPWLNARRGPLGWTGAAAKTRTERE